MSDPPLIHILADEQPIALLLEGGRSPRHWSFSEGGAGLVTYFTG